MIALSQKTSQEKQKRRSTRLLVAKTRTLKVVLVCVVVGIVFGNYKIAQNQYWEEGKLRHTLEDSRAVTTFKKETYLFNATNAENGNKHTSARNTNSTNPPPNTITHQKDHPPTIHLVFSTACSLSHDWQSYLFFFQAMYHGQQGDVTRIVSGCSPDDERKMKQLHQKQISIMSPHFKLHFTPEYGKRFEKVSYQQTKYWNKPFGFKHWMEHRFGYSWDDENDSNITVPEYDNHIVILVDPDMLLQRPFTSDFNNVPNSHWSKYYRQHPEQLVGKVAHGHPVAQDYSFGNLWISKVRRHLDKIVGPHSPVHNLTPAQEEFVFSAGPPYLMTARDAYRISHYWTQFLPKLYQYHSQFMAEMYAYCMAVAHLNLRNQISWGMMISNVQVTNGEGWAFLSKDNRACDTQKYADVVPNVIHFCQRFSIGEYFINKYLFPKDILSCHHPLMELPPFDILETTFHSSFGDSSVIHYNDRHDIKRYRNAFVICTLFRAINAMATFYKDHHCDRTDPNTNYETSYNHFRSEEGKKLLQRGGMFQNLREKMQNQTKEKNRNKQSSF